jgi:beta-glucosidase
MREALLAAHHVLMAHGRSVQAIRAHATKKPSVSLALVGCASSPLTESPEDIEAARAATHDVDGHHFWNHRWWGDPVVFGHYPEEGLQAYGKDLPKFKASDFDTICQPIDFLGMNIYWGGSIKADDNGNRHWVPFSKGHAHTHFDWAVSPEILY